MTRAGDLTRSRERVMIYLAIQAAPGATTRDLEEKTQLHRHTIRKRLVDLIGSGLVSLNYRELTTTRSTTIHACYYPTAPPDPAAKARLETMLPKQQPMGTAMIRAVT